MVGPSHRFILFICLSLFFGLLRAEITLQWDANNEADLVGYNVYRSQDSGSGYLRLNNHPVTQPVYTDSSPTPGTTFYYVVTAINTAGLESGYSNEISAAISVANSPPEAVDDAATTLEDTPVTIQVLANDQDPDQDTINISDVGQPASGAITLAAGAIVYHPAANYFGLDSFVYSISDPFGATDSATVSVTIIPANDPPLANPDTAATPEDQAVLIEVRANDSDPDGDPLAVVSLGPAGNGTVSLTAGGAVLYEPNPDFNGSDLFPYAISDGAGGSAASFVTVEVAEVNHPPEVDAGPDQVVKPGATVQPSGHASDPEGDALTFFWYQTSGLSVDIQNADTLNPTILLPRGDKNSAWIWRGTLTLVLEATDGLQTGQDTVRIQVGKGKRRTKKMILPSLESQVGPILEDAFLGIALLNKGASPQQVLLSTLDRDGRILESAPLPRLLRPDSQYAFLAREVGIDRLRTSSLVLEGQNPPIDGWFMIGNNRLTKLDGLDGQAPESETLYFPFSQQEGGARYLFLFNSADVAAGEVILRLFSHNGALLEEIRREIDTNGSLLDSVDHLFSNSAPAEPVYVQIHSDAALTGLQVQRKDESLAMLAAQPSVLVERLMAPHFFVDAGQSTTWVQLLNTGSEPIQVRLEAHVDESDKVIVSNHRLAPRELLDLDIGQLPGLEEVRLKLQPGEILTGHLDLHFYSETGEALSAPVIGSVRFSAGGGKAVSALPLSRAGATEIEFLHIAQSAALDPNGEWCPHTANLERFEPGGDGWAT